MGAIFSCLRIFSCVLALSAIAHGKAFAQSSIGQYFGDTNLIVQDGAGFRLQGEPSFSPRGGALDSDWTAACERSGARLMQEIHSHLAQVEGDEAQAAELAQSLSANAALRPLQNFEHKMRHAALTARLKRARLEALNQFCDGLFREDLVTTGDYPSRVGKAVESFMARFQEVQRQAQIYSNFSDAADAALQRRASDARALEDMIRVAPLADRPVFR